MQVSGIRRPSRKVDVTRVATVTSVLILNNRVHRNARELKRLNRVRVRFRGAQLSMMGVTIDRTRLTFKITYDQVS